MQFPNIPHVGSLDDLRDLYKGGHLSSTNVALGAVISVFDYVTFANVITVAKSDGMFTTIQGAIDSANPIVHSGTAQAGAAATITLAATASAVDDYYNGKKVRLTGGTGSGQIRTIIDYDGTTKIATVDSNWTVNPDATTTYAVKSIISVLINPGIYIENITCKECVNLIGTDKTACIIKPVSSPSLYYANTIVIKDLTIDKTGGDTGPTTQLNDWSNIFVEDCIITTSDSESGYAFKCTQGGPITFRRCELYGKATSAIKLNDDDADFNVNFNDCTISMISGNGYGISVSVADGTPTLIVYNSIVKKGGTSVNSIYGSGAGIAGLIFKTAHLRLNAAISGPTDLITTSYNVIDADI